MDVYVEYENGYVTSIDLECAEGTHCQVSRQIWAYLNGERQTLDFPVFMKGTAFQKAVWRAAMTIPYGQTRTYREIAHMIGNKNAYRAVGSALGKNPLLIKVPCHRIIKSDGSIGGFSGNVHLKKRLLEIECQHAC